MPRRRVQRGYFAPPISMCHLEDRSGSLQRCLGVSGLPCARARSAARERGACETARSPARRQVYRGSARWASSAGRCRRSPYPEAWPPVNRRRRTPAQSSAPRCRLGAALARHRRSVDCADPRPPRRSSASRPTRTREAAGAVQVLTRSLLAGNAVWTTDENQGWSAGCCRNLRAIFR